MITIDKSAFTAEELAQYEALLAKAKVDPEAAKKEMEGEEPPAGSKKPAKKEEVNDVDETKKSAVEVPDFVKDALAKSEEFITRMEKQEMTELAKKYAALGQKPEELGEKLYNLKKSDQTMYDTCVSMLDDQLNLIEKSNLFAEIGKSASGTPTAGGAVAKAEAKAYELMKSDPTLSYTQAIAKSWEDPALMAEYDAEYAGR